MDTQSNNTSFRSSSHSSTTSGSSRLNLDEISPTSAAAIARITAQDSSFGTASWVSAQSGSSVPQRAQQTLGLLHEACLKTNRLQQKIHEKGWLQINKTQCKEFLQLKGLTAALSKFLEELRKEASDVQAECWNAAQEMYKIIFITEGFVEDCAVPISPVKGLKKVGNGTDFVLIRYQLIWCVRVLRMVLCQAKGESNADFSSNMNDIDSSLSIEESKALEAHCRTDRKALLENLQKKLKRLRSKSEDRILQFLSSLIEENGRRENSSSFVISQREGPSIMQQNVSLKCVLVDLSELKWDHARPFLGHGSFGVVSCATWLGEGVAVKNVQANYDVFKQEVTLQAGLQHPHILPLFGYSFNAENDCCYMVMELAQANLRTYLTKQGRNLTLESKVDIMLQIAEGMKFLHSKNLVHRDLKAENILVQWKGITVLRDAQYVHAKLCDFGLARTKFNGSNSIRRAPNVGTTFWRAPEVLRESSADDYNQGADFSCEADVYSFAMTFYEVLTGKIPFQDVSINLSNFRVKVLQGERPELPRDCSEYLACYIKRCWHGIPHRRPSFADICKMLRHFKSLLLRIGERPPIDLHIFSIFSAADFESIRCNLGMEWCINAIRAGKIFREVLLSWIMIEKYRLNAKDGEKYNEALLVAAENFANITGSGHDFHRAFNFIQDAAESGHAEAQWKVGLFLELGLGVEKNEKEAIKWYEEAVKQNYTCALVELSRSYELGRGVEKRHDLAAEYSKKAHVDSNGKTVRCINELLILLNEAKDPTYSELAAKRLSELTFDEGRPLLSGPNLENIQCLVNALGKNATSEIGRYIVSILKELAVDAEVTEEIIYSGGIAAIVKHLKLVRANDGWCRNAVETLGLLFCGSDVLIQCLKENVSKLWLRRNTEVISSLMSIQSRAPGVSNDKALEIRNRLEYFGLI